jgi:hypothetical protein
MLMGHLIGASGYAVGSPGDNHGAVVPARRAEQERLLVRRRADAGGGDVGVQRFGKGVMARHHVLLAAPLVQPDQPARALWIGDRIRTLRRASQLENGADLLPGRALP